MLPSRSPRFLIPIPMLVALALVILFPDLILILPRWFMPKFV